MSFKIFPFSPGIPWEINKGILKPKLSFQILNKTIDDKNIIVACYGGLFEAFLTLYFFEAFNKIWPSKKLIWSGNQLFKELIEANGLAKFSDEIPKSILSKYPVPLFFDKCNNAIFNPLNNYMKIKPYYGGLKSFNNNDICFKQIWSNSLLDSKHICSPKFRNDFYDQKFQTSLLLSKFDYNKPYILIVDETKHSMHSVNCISWNAQQIKSFAAIVSQIGYNVVILTSHTSAYLNNNLNSIFIFDFNLNSFFNLVKKSKLIISKEIDYLLIAQLISDNYLISNNSNKKCFDFNRLNYFLKTKNKVKLLKSVTQNHVIDILKNT